MRWGSSERLQRCKSSMEKTSLLPSGRSSPPTSLGGVGGPTRPIPGCFLQEVVCTFLSSVCCVPGTTLGTLGISE